MTSTPRCSTCGVPSRTRLVPPCRGFRITTATVRKRGCWAGLRSLGSPRSGTTATLRSTRKYTASRDRLAIASPWNSSANFSTESRASTDRPLFELGMTEARLEVTVFGALFISETPTLVSIFLAPRSDSRQKKMAVCFVTCVNRCDQELLVLHHCQRMVQRCLYSSLSASLL